MEFSTFGVGRETSAFFDITGEWFLAENVFTCFKRVHHLGGTNRSMRGDFNDVDIVTSEQVVMAVVDFCLREELIATIFRCFDIHIGESDYFDSKGFGRLQMILGYATTTDERELMRFRTSWAMGGVIEFGSFYVLEDGSVIW